MEWQENRWPIVAAFVIAGLVTAWVALFPPGARATAGGTPVRATTVAPKAPAGGGSTVPAVGCGG